MRTKSNFAKDFIGGESCLVNSAPKGLIRTAFPTLPSSFSTLDYSSSSKKSPDNPPVVHGLKRSMAVSSVVQSLRKSPVTVIANGETVRALIIASPDFAKHCTVDLARLVGSRVQSEGGARACGLTSLGFGDSVDDGPLSIARLENSFMVQHQWAKARNAATSDCLKRRDLEREELRRRRSII
jgi:hypothetical protein